MADTESIREAAHARVPFSAWIGMVLLFAIFAIIVLAVIGPSPRGADFHKTGVKKRQDALKVVQDDQKTLGTYAWVDKNKGAVRIPIDRAMELTMADLSRRKPAPAYPIAASSPAANAAAQAPASPTPAKPQPSPEPKGSPRVQKGERTNQSEVGNKPASAVTPPPALPGTQPGATTTPAASPGAPSAKPPVSPTPTPKINPPGSPLPVRGNSPSSPSPSPS
jgi:hypothetical protein